MADISLPNTPRSLVDEIASTAGEHPTPASWGLPLAVVAFENWLTSTADRHGQTLEEYLHHNGMAGREIDRALRLHRWDLCRVASILHLEQAHPGEVFPFTEWQWIDRGDTAAGMAQLIEAVVAAASRMGVDLAQYYADLDRYRAMSRVWLDGQATA